MSATRVAVLTPPGTAAIATLAVAGPTAWDVVRSRFRPANGRPLPDAPIEKRFWFGTLGDGTGDEVVVAAKRGGPEPRVEVHCHGGRQVVRMLVALFAAAGCVETPGFALQPDAAAGEDPRALEPLAHAPTLRTASVLLDQYHGAFAKAVEAATLDLDRLDDLAKFAPLGRHLVAPWKVVVAGAPNVGKSSLVNALAGYQRSVVAAVPGTTRDVVTTRLAFDGWPVELADTAGLRDATEPLEAEGIERARRTLAGADLVVWVIDGTDPNPVWPDDDLEPILVVNKSDLPLAFDPGPSAIPVSATTGDGLAQLTLVLTRFLVPDPPAPGAAVPFTPLLADAIERAARLRAIGKSDAAREVLSTCLPGSPLS